MLNRDYQQIASKLGKTRALISDPDVKTLIPETKKYSLKHLKAMLERYRVVYAKPDIGSYGKGVMRIERMENGGYRVHSGTVSKTFPSLKRMYHALQPMTKKRTHLLQQGVELAKIDGRPVDLRVMVQKPDGEWKVSGVVAKMAGRNRVITNYHGGGTVLPFEEAMERSLGLSEKQIGELWHRIQDACMKATRVLTRRYPGLKELGYDLGIDGELKIWIIEVNTRPGYGIFKKLPDKTMYSMLVQYNRQL